MTRNEKIGLLENYSTFLAANGYMDEDWRSEPPYAIDEFLKLTEDKKAPVLAEYVQRLAKESADVHFNMKHEGDWYAHYYGFIYGFQKHEELEKLKKDS